MSKFSMDYCTTKEESVAPQTIHIEVDQDADLRQYFLAFVEMTRIMGFYSKSWERVITEAYKYCVKHEDSFDDYDIYNWASDTIDNTF